MVMKDKRKKRTKSPPKDFVQTETRVGRKRRLPENQTRADVKLKPVKVGEQTNITNYDSKGQYITSKCLTLEEVTAQTTHHNVNVRREAFLGIRELLDRFPQHFSPQLGFVLGTLVRSLTDADETVRKSYRNVAEKIFQLLANGEQATETKTNRLTPFTEHIGQQLRSAMTHRDIDVRIDCVSFIELLLIQSNAVGGNFMYRIAYACVKGTSNIQSINMDDQHQIMTAFICDLYNKCLTKISGSKHFYPQLFRVGRISLQLLGLASNQTNELNMDHQIPLNSLVSASLSGLLSKTKSTNDSTQIQSASPSSSMIQLVSDLCDIWSQLSSHLSQNQQPSKQQKVSPSNEIVLRQIIMDFSNNNSIDSNRQRISVTTADESVLIASAARLDVLRLILNCIRYLTLSSADRHVLTPTATVLGKGQLQIGSRLLNEVLLPKVHSVNCPNGVNKKIYSSIHRQLSHYLIQAVSVLLRSVDDDNCLPSPQTSAILLAIYSNSILRIPELLTLEMTSTKELTQKQIKLFLLTLSEAINVTSHSSDSLMFRSMKSMISLTSEASKLNESVLERTEVSSVTNKKSELWERNLNSALRKIGLTAEGENLGSTSYNQIHRADRGFTVLAKTSQNNQGYGNNDEDPGNIEEKNVLIQLKAKKNASMYELVQSVENQMVVTFERLWKILDENKTEQGEDNVNKNDGRNRTDQQISSNDTNKNIDSQNNVEYTKAMNKTETEHHEDTDSKETSEIVSSRNNHAAYSEKIERKSSLSVEKFSYPPTPSRFVSNKRRKLSAEGDYVCLLSNPVSPSIDSPIESPQSIGCLSNSTTSPKTSFDSDLRVCLVLLFASFIRLPVDDSIRISTIMSPSQYSNHILLWTLKQVEHSAGNNESKPFQMANLLLPTLRGNFMVQWVDLASQLSQKNSSSASLLLLDLLLSFSQRLIQLASCFVSGIDAMQKSTIAAASMFILHHIYKAFFIPQNMCDQTVFTQASKGVQRIIILLVVELSLSNLPLQETSEESFLFRFFSAVFATSDEDLISLFVDLVLASNSVPIRIRVSFAKSIASRFSPDPVVLRCCEAHANRLRSCIENEVGSQFFTLVINDRTLSC